MLDDSNFKIKAKDILPFNFYTYGKPFAGSYRKFRYRVKMEKRELPLPEGSPEGTKPPVEKYFAVAVWPGPYGYAAADPETIIKTEYPFSEESYEAIVVYLNEKLEEIDTAQ